MTLGREIDYEFGVTETPGLEDENATRFYNSACARISIRFVIFGKRVSELERDSAAGDTYTIDGVDESLSVNLQNVPLPQLDH